MSFELCTRVILSLASPLDEMLAYPHKLPYLNSPSLHSFLISLSEAISFRNTVFYLMHEAPLCIVLLRLAIIYSWKFFPRDWGVHCWTARFVLRSSGEWILFGNWDFYSVCSLSTYLRASHFQLELQEVAFRASIIIQPTAGCKISL